MKLHGTQTFCEITWLQTSVLGLEEDKITWHSNYYHTKTSSLHGLEEKEIAVTQTLENHECAGLEEDKIAGFSNFFIVIPALEKGKIAWYSNTCYTFQPEHTWKRKKLQGTQTNDVGGFAL